MISIVIWDGILSLGEILLDGYTPKPNDTMDYDDTD
jgi:hypothetical protein